MPVKQFALSENKEAESNFDEDYDFKLGDYLNYLTNKSSKLNKTNNSSIDSTSNRFFLFRRSSSA